jgi:hypothetical protein
MHMTASTRQVGDVTIVDSAGGLCSAQRALHCAA